MLKINSKTSKYLKNSIGNFAWQFKKGQAKKLKIRQDRERERERWRESLRHLEELCEELSHSSVPFRLLYLCFFLRPAFSGEFASYIFLFAHFVFCFAFCFWLLVSYHLFLLFSADLEHFSYSLCVYYFASSY